MFRHALRQSGRGSNAGRSCPRGGCSCAVHAAVKVQNCVDNLSSGGCCHVLRIVHVHLDDELDVMVAFRTAVADVRIAELVIESAV